MSVPLPSKNEEIATALREDFEARIFNAKELCEISMKLNDDFLHAEQILYHHVSQLMQSHNFSKDNMKMYRSLLRNYNDSGLKFRDHERYAHKELNYIGKQFKPYCESHI